ncbi:MAG: hypothetical protein MSB01_05465 [Bacteroidales bacterium]|nr:hypothetical protein [Bacteroidales bacterium]MCI7572256.1 hypothetical protein [Bacteroidales bacterium]MDY4933554.1 hypothetical protein [Candidatus Onthomorpha sp.]MDY5737383.1 hypothetical protein [Candidatus Onthomorpha sp.]
MLKKDNLIFGMVVAALSTLLTIGLLWLILFCLNMSINDNAKLFLFSFVPAIVELRWYVKLQYMKTTKGVLSVLFFGFCFMLYYLYAAGSFAGKF